jgi:hypothetical protein
MAGPADWQAAADKAAALVGGAPPPAVDVAAALAAGPDDANYWLAVGLTVKSGADVDYWLPVLVNGQNADGSWGAGALATAGAVIGLDAANAGAYASQIAAGADWLAANQTADGSWAGGAADAYVVQALKAALAGAGAEDNVPPIATLIAPLNGVCLSNAALNIQGRGTDSGAQKVVKLQLKWDGNVLGADFTWPTPGGIADTGVCQRTVGAPTGAPHTASVRVEDGTVPANWAIASANVQIDAAAPNVPTLASFTGSKTVVIDNDAPVADTTTTYLYGVPTGSPIKALANFVGTASDPAGGCGIASMTFLGDKTRIGLNVAPLLPGPLQGLAPAFVDGFPYWEGASAFWPAVAKVTTADTTLGTVNKFTAAPSVGTYTLGAYEVQVPSVGSNTNVGMAPVVDMDASLNGVIQFLEGIFPASPLVKPGSFAEFTMVPNSTWCQGVQGTDPTRFQVRAQPAAPVAGPGLALAGAGGTNLAVGTYQYKVAFVSAGTTANSVVFLTAVGYPMGAVGAYNQPMWSESALSPATSIPTVAGNQKVTVTLPSLNLGAWMAVPGLRDMAARRIYRTKVNGSEFFYLTTVQNNFTTATYTDDKADGSLKTPEINGRFFVNMNMRNLVIQGAECESYTILTGLPRYWPSRGRYAVNLKARATDGAAFATTSAAPIPQPQLAVPIFEDVQASDWAWDNVERIRNHKPAPRLVNVTKGTAAFPESALPLKRFYAPDTPVMRRDMAIFIMRARGIVTDPTYNTARFVDVGDSTNSYWREVFCDVNALFDLGISIGCKYDPATTNRWFCPNGYVTRAEMVVFLGRATGASQTSPLPVPLTFVDISGVAWAQGWIETAAGTDVDGPGPLGPFNPPGDGLVLTTGCHIIGGVKYFCPNDWCSRREMAVFLCRAFTVPVVAPTPTNPW